MSKFHSNKDKPTIEKERIIYYNKTIKFFENLSKKKWKSKDSKGFIKNWITKHSSRLVEFLKYKEATPDNNPAERDLRSLVVIRKISGGSKSKDGAKITAINMSIIETWAKQGLSIINDIPEFGLRFA